MTRRSVSFLGTLLVCLWTLPAFGTGIRADRATGHRPARAHLVVDGTAILERDGRTDTRTASMPLLAGDRVRTQAGRVEVLFADGSTLHLDEHTMVDFQSDEVVRLLSGRVRLSVSGPARDVAYRVDAPSAWVQINNPGEYRVSAAARTTRSSSRCCAAARSSSTNRDAATCRPASAPTHALQAAPSPAYVFNSAAWDSFDRWSESRRDQRLGVSAQYLPEDVRPYAPAFDTYGSWRHEPAYGVRVVPARRRSAGVRTIAAAGRACGRTAGRGLRTIPGDGRRITTAAGASPAGPGSGFPDASWAPAWVSWGYAPGYVSWCPLGWNNRPVLGFSVNYYGGRRYDPWYAWSVLPRAALQRAPTCTCRAIRRSASTRGCTVPSWSTTADLTCTLPSIVREYRSAPRAARRPGVARIPG